MRTGPLAASTLAALALALAGCATMPSPTKLLGLSSVDQAALDACRRPLEAKACAGQPDPQACWAQVDAEYQALPDPAARKRYLVDAGCPSPTVDVWLPDAR
jgi:hypothetical protein